MQTLCRIVALSLATTLGAQAMAYADGPPWETPAANSDTLQLEEKQTTTRLTEPGKITTTVKKEKPVKSPSTKEPDLKDFIAELAGLIDIRVIFVGSADKLPAYSALDERGGVEVKTVAAVNALTTATPTPVLRSDDSKDIPTQGSLLNVEVQGLMARLETVTEDKLKLPTVQLQLATSKLGLVNKDLEKNTARRTQPEPKRVASELQEQAKKIRKAAGELNETIRKLETQIEKNKGVEVEKETRFRTRVWRELMEVLEIFGLRTYVSRVDNKTLYIGDLISVPEQVRLRVQVFIVDKLRAGERGISLGTGLTTGSYDATGNPVGFGRFGTDFANSLSGFPSIAGSAFPPYTGVVPGNVPGFGTVPGRAVATLGVGNILAQISLLEQIGAAQTLIDQQVITNDGRQVVFQRNSQVRIPLTLVTGGAVVVGSAPADITSRLELTPTILPSRKQVEVDINANFSSPSLQGGFSEINTNSIKLTRLRLDSGGYALLGGFEKTDTFEITTQVPVLGSIPIIGELFKATRQITRQEILVILIQPEVQRQTLLYGDELLSSQENKAPDGRQAPEPITPLNKYKELPVPMRLDQIPAGIAPPLTPEKSSVPTSPD